MVEGQVTLLLSPARGSASRFSSSPPRRLNTIAKLAPPSRRRPLSSTGAGPSREIVDPSSTAAGPCDAIFDTCDVEDRLRRRLLLLPTLCRFLRLSFRFSLLRHCCPPSLSGWRYRSVQSRIDPHYIRITTAGKKITVTPLNFVCKPPRPAAAARHAPRERTRHRAEKFFVRAISRKILRISQKCR